MRTTGSRGLAWNINMLQALQEKLPVPRYSMPEVSWSSSHESFASSRMTLGRGTFLSSCWATYWTHRKPLYRFHPLAPQTCLSSLCPHPVVIMHPSGSVLVFECFICFSEDLITEDTPVNGVANQKQPLTTRLDREQSM